MAEKPGGKVSLVDLRFVRVPAPGAHATLMGPPLLPFAGRDGTPRLACIPQLMGRDPRFTRKYAS